MNECEGEDRSSQMNVLEGASVEKVDKFCYLGDTLEEDGGYFRL